MSSSVHNTEQREIAKYALTNGNGESVAISALGARLIEWQTLLAGDQRNIIVGHDSDEGYLSDDCYMGAIVGPFANRLANASYEVDGKLVQLHANEGNNMLHGGADSIENIMWQLESQSENSVVLSCELPKGHNGNPEAIALFVAYQLSDDNALKISIEVSASGIALAGPTAHPYFNLSGKKETVSEHSLYVNATEYTPANDVNIPTGALAPIEHLGLQSTVKNKVGDANNGLLDNNFLISPILVKSVIEEGLFQQVVEHAKVVSPDEKLALTARSNYPAIQIYTGEHIKPPLLSCQGLCLEPQFCPNSPNQESFPFRYTSPEQPLVIEIIYQLSAN